MNKQMIELADLLDIRHDNLPREVLAEQVRAEALGRISELTAQVEARADLAAQIERVRLVVKHYHSENITCEEAINELVFVLNQPESVALAALAALAALKARWQAEAFSRGIKCKFCEDTGIANARYGGVDECECQRTQVQGQ